jgi:hypothetical protein
MKALRLAAIAALALLGTTAWAGSLDLNLSGSAARIEYAQAVTPSGLEGDVSYMHNQDEGDVAGIGLHLVDLANSGSDPLQVGVGGRLFFINPKGPNSNGTALGVGGFVRYTLPQYNRVALSGHAYFAPSIVSFGDADRFFEYAFRVEYNVLRQANVYVGYRHVSADFAGLPTLTMDTGLHVGLRITF